MTGFDAIRTSLEMTRKDLHWFLGDFTDAELFVRPIPEANHAAWQIGNIIGGDYYFLKAVVPDAKFPGLPEGFMDRHGTKGAKDDGPKGFLTKAEYLKLFDAGRDAVIAGLNSLTDADLDKPTTGDMANFAANTAAVFLVASHHTWMHIGQFSVIRRKLGKPNLM
jgi:hypothetical protein